MCTKVWNPERRTVAENLAILEGRVESQLDRAALAVLTDMAREAGESMHPDDVIEGARHDRATVERAYVDATGKGLVVEHIYTCDWCATPASVVIDGGQDFACSWHLGYHFGAAIAAGEQFRIVAAPRR